MTTTSAERRIDDALHGGPGEHAVRGAGDDALGALAFMSARAALHERAGGVDHVVDDDAVLALHVADDVHDLALVGALAALVDDGERGVEALGVGARALHAARIGRDDARRR